MSTHATYKGPGDCPVVIPVFPLSGALLLPRGQMPLNIFEPRYLAMVDDAMRTDRIIGMIQPDPEGSGAANPKLYRVGCAGRVTQYAETGDGRYLISLTGVSRFRITSELASTSAYRRCHVSYDDFAVDFEPRAGEELVDRDGVLKALRDFVESNDLKVDWAGIDEAPDEALVNALCMMSPFGVREKQAMLEAPDLKTRAEILIAVTQMELVRGSGPEPTMQ
ncbi:LON peptidase substrate-binding domain-containing protein [Methylobacterium sp. NEAU K]|uniref:LON peptidase substrate-binding domain-containing protein n=1 Tax=Methylobacterium sp. NEAU K TaxID=3064946 RepID=UPI0027374E41|nr:LON peptidase substrate-binding domain-containing protein [Methylobacterium sp. NEAU K]MDP4004018.1 LON peptidase substrate-binding domain-containing protein [Methylobacterium sp. NEAU K]